MHDIDRTQLQAGTLGEQEIGYHEFESEFQETEGEGEFEDELFYEGEGEDEGETYEAEAYEGEDEGEFFEAEGEGESYEYEEERVYEDEAWEVEMAAELLAVRDEAELEQFLGSLIKGAAKGLSSLAKKAAPILLPALKSVAKQALPFVGGALGGLAGGPIGAKIGSQLASSAGDMFGLELEGLSFEDQEFEVAKQFVRFANDSVNMLGETAHHHADPKRAAHAAINASAQRHAPGLQASSRPRQGGRAPHTGAAPAPPHHNGAAAPSHGGPRPPHPGGPRPTHQGSARSPQHGGPPPSHPGASRAPQPGGPRPSHPAGTVSPQPGGPRPTQTSGHHRHHHVAGPRPPQHNGTPVAGAAPRPQTSTRPSSQPPTAGMPGAGNGLMRAPGSPAQAPPSGTSTTGGQWRDWYHTGRMNGDGNFGHVSGGEPGTPDAVGYVDGIEQGGPATEQGGGGRGRTGRWYRRGNRIILIGV